MTKARVAIVDLKVGNLYSVRQACLSVGLDAVVTSSKQEIAQANGVILPGVGAFGNAMTSMRKTDLLDTLKRVAREKPFMGICLGMQLLMTESYEFGRHEGLGVIEGSVVRFDYSMHHGKDRPKVPHIGWNRVYSTSNVDASRWTDGMMNGISNGEHMYFVHSFYVKPCDEDVELAHSRYGDIQFSACLQKNQLFACQFHPERSGRTGLEIYKNYSAVVNAAMEGR